MVLSILMVRGPTLPSAGKGEIKYRKPRSLHADGAGQRKFCSDQCFFFRFSLFGSLIFYGPCSGTDKEGI